MKKYEYLYFTRYMGNWKTEGGNEKEPSAQQLANRLSLEGWKLFIANMDVMWFKRDLKDENADRLYQDDGMGYIAPGLPRCPMPK